MIRRISTAIAVALLAAACIPAAAQTGPYHLGPGDVVQLNVLQQPSLDRELQIRPDGTAVVPVVGEIELAGLTTREAEELLTSKLRLFNRDIQDVSLTVTQYNALRVYVLGAVGNPGSYTFDSSPSLWDVVREAGGINPDANAAAIRVVAAREGQTVNTVHDMTPFLTGSGPAPLVELLSGDTVIIPTMAEVAASPQEGVQVFGGVGAAGTYAINEPTRLMSVLMLAGAPLAEGDMEKVWWVHKHDNGTYTSNLIDLDLFLEMGDLSGNPMIHPGDTVHLQRREPGFWRTTYPIILGSISTAAAIIFTLDRIQN
jgi:polysaccharide export outer membrane protein